MYPHSFAVFASNGKWKAFLFLKLISEIIAQSVARGGGRIIVNLPPRHGKSQLISKWTPIWFLNLFPDRNVILTTYEAGFAADWGYMVRNEIRDNPICRVKIQNDSHAKDNWHTTDGGGMKTAGIGGPITGKGGHLVLVDDPVKNWDEARSPAQRQRVVDWFNSTLYTRLEPGGTLVILMTRWHEEDLSGYLLKTQPGAWTHINFPAVAEGIDMLGRNEGQALCPERFDEAALAAIKQSVGSIVWNGLYQQRPTALEGGIIQRAWIQFYTTPPASFREVIQSWDLSFKKTTDGSFVVGQVWGRSHSQFYLLHQVRARMSYVETKQAIRMVSARFQEARRKIVEDKANGPAILSELQSEIPGLIPFQSSDSKEARLVAASPFFEAGNVFLPDPSIALWIGEYVEELVNFPNAANDDQVDATSQALLVLSKIRGGELIAVDGITAAQDAQVFY